MRYGTHTKGTFKLTNRKRKKNKERKERKKSKAFWKVIKVDRNELSENIFGERELTIVKMSFSLQLLYKSLRTFIKPPCSVSAVERGNHSLFISQRTASRHSAWRWHAHTVWNTVRSAEACGLRSWTPRKKVFKPSCSHSCWRLSCLTGKRKEALWTASTCESPWLGSLTI